MDEIIDLGESQNKEVPQAVKTLAILSIVGSSLWILILLIIMFYFMSAGSALGALGGSMFADAMAAILIGFLFFIGLNVGSLIGAIKMMKGKKSMFILYAIMNGIWALLFLITIGNQNDTLSLMLTLLTALSSIGFIIGFGTQMKNMPS
jgi:hypothetical protein